MSKSPIRRFVDLTGTDAAQLHYATEPSRTEAPRSVEELAREACGCLRYVGGDGREIPCGRCLLIARAITAREIEVMDLLAHYNTCPKLPMRCGRCIRWERLIDKHTARIEDSDG